MIFISKNSDCQNKVMKIKKFAIFKADHYQLEFKPLRKDNSL